MNKLDKIQKDIEELKSGLLINEPAILSKRDLVDSFFGALFLGVTFTIKGLLIRVSQGLTGLNIILIIVSTLLILTAEIYFIGYSRVIKKEERKFGQFWFKRIVLFYAVAILTSTFLVFVFGLNNFTEISGSLFEIYKLIIVISMPCAIGASITDLLKRY
jgi:uncharacterized membrane protein